jgi:hypothetical protein
MQKKVSEIMCTGIQAGFFYGNKFCFGTMTSCSENGIFIITRTCFPLKTKFDMLVSSEKRVLKVPVEVCKLLKTDDMYEGMGVELLN